MLLVVQSFRLTTRVVQGTGTKFLTLLSRPPVPPPRMIIQCHSVCKYTDQLEFPFQSYQSIYFLVCQFISRPRVCIMIRHLPFMLHQVRCSILDGTKTMTMMIIRISYFSVSLLAYYAVSYTWLLEDGCLLGCGAV